MYRTCLCHNPYCSLAIATSLLIAIRECDNTHNVGMAHPLNINNGRLTSQKDRMEDLTQHSQEAYGQVQSPKASPLTAKR